MLNLASLLLGLFAWGFGLAAIRKRGSYLRSGCSFALCAAALVLQFYEISHRVSLRDWSALMDTVPTLTKVAALLLAVTVILNGIALYRGNRTHHNHG